MKIGIGIEMLMKIGRRYKLNKINENKETVSLQKK